MRGLEYLVGDLESQDVTLRREGGAHLGRHETGRSYHALVRSPIMIRYHQVLDVCRYAR